MRVRRRTKKRRRRTKKRRGLEEEGRRSGVFGPGEKQEEDGWREGGREYRMKRRVGGRVVG